MLANTQIHHVKGAKIRNSERLELDNSEHFFTTHINVYTSDSDHAYTITLFSDEPLKIEEE